MFAKKNCLCVISAANAGKNFWFDAVIHFYINFGQIGNFNKYSQFPMMDAVNRRILMWNESACESSSFETVKILFGRDLTEILR